jgi:hypothetical protein
MAALGFSMRPATKDNSWIVGSPNTNRSKELFDGRLPSSIQLLTEYRRREAHEATSWLACLTLRSPQDKKRAAAHHHFICPEFDVKFRIETILLRALDCKCSETVDMVQANPNRNGDKQCIG